jgi:antitoxin (DNA-binding transcriptional repressor) of toxin-antitoxin stability system
MQTITITAARAKLGHWLARAVRGEEIGVVVGAKVVALRPVPIQAADYLETEYGLSTEEADRAIARIKAETRQAKAAGELIPLEEFAVSYAPGRRRQKRILRSGQTHS